MHELSLIKERIRRALHGDAWHGSSVRELIKDISAFEPASHPIVNAHSIWEIVLHLTCWHRVVKRRLRGEYYEPNEEENWPAIIMINEASWKIAQEDIYQSAEELLVELDLFSEEKFEELVPGKSFSYGIMLHGIIEHDLYHGGQIAILKKIL